jgi:hypothetical protein
MRHVGSCFLRLALVSILYVSVFSSNAVASGRKVSITLKDSSSITGELLAVRDSNLIINRELWVSEQKLQSNHDSLTIVPFTSAVRIHVAGHRNSWVGAGVGLAAGMGVGAFMGYHVSTSNSNWSSDRGFNAVVGSLMGILPGFFSGMIVGAFVETDERDIDPRDKVEMGLLSKHARYQEGEPEFIKSIGAP